MPTTEKCPARATNTDQAVENLAGHLDNDHATPHRLALHPNSGNDWWSWCITINGRPAIRFRDVNRAVVALTYLLDDMENGVDITRRDNIWVVAAGSMRARDIHTNAYEICKGWA